MTLLRFFNVANIFIASMCFFSCSSEQERQSIPVGGGERITIDASQVDKEVDISDWIEDIRVFPLEEVEGSMLGGVQKTLLTDKHLIIFDKMDIGRIVVFDRGGKFVKALEIVGDGPDKLVQITDCWLNNQDNLEVYDRSLREVLVFNDKFEVENALSANHTVRFNYLINITRSKGYVAFAGYNGQDEKPFKMAFLDNVLTVQNTALSFDSALVGASIAVPINPFFRVGDTLRFYQDFDPRIYTVNPERKLDVRYYLDYVHRPFPFDFEEKIIKENLDLYRGEDYHFEEIRDLYQGYTGFRGHWIESRDYAVFSSFNEGQDHFASIYHKGKREIIAQGIDLSEKENYRLWIPTHFQAADAKDNRFVLVLPAYWLAAYLFPESTFYEPVNRDPATLFVVEVKLK